MEDPDDKVYLGVDPGTATGGIVLARHASGSAAVLRDETLELGKGDTSLPCFKEAVKATAGSAAIDEFVIEFPSATYHGSQNGAIMVGVCRVAAELAAWGAYSYGRPQFVGADTLRRGGHVIANDDRPVLFRRIYGEPASSEHVRDAGLVVAKYRGIL